MNCILADISTAKNAKKCADWMMHNDGAAVSPGSLVVWVSRAKVNTEDDQHLDDAEKSLTEPPEALK